MSQFIRDHVPVTELLTGLAEECSELSWAALKLHRVMDGRNPTPAEERATVVRMYEEIADVWVYCKQLDLPLDYLQRIMNKKEERWERRLRGEPEE